jgi:hypothetical protein
VWELEDAVRCDTVTVGIHDNRNVDVGDSGVEAEKGLDMSVNVLKFHKD